MMRPARAKPSGFTMIEILITLVILAVLATYSAQTIRSSTQVKIKLQKQIDQQSALRNALNVMERDINLGFNYRDPNYEMQQLLKKKKAESATAAGQPLAPEDEKAAAPPAIVTMFFGEPDKLSLTSLGNVRIAPDSQEGDQMKVTYSSKGCKPIVKSDKAQSCIFRRTYPVLDGNFSEGGEETAILEGVTKLSFRYFGEGKDDWVDTWKTSEGADDVTRDQFPQAVEVTVETEAEGKKMKMITVAEIHFTNNKKKESVDPNAPQPGKTR